MDYNNTSQIVLISGCPCTLLLYFVAIAINILSLYFSEYAQSSVCSDVEIEQTFIPPDFSEYYNPEEAYDQRFGTNANLSDGSNNDLYIISAMTVPVECQGNVTSIQFCYLSSTSNIGSSVSFMLHMLTRDGNMLTVSRSQTITFSVSLNACHDPDPGASRNRDIACCDIENFQSPFPTGSALSFAVEIDSFSLIAMFTSNIDRYEAPSSFKLPSAVGDSFTLPSDLQMVNEFPLLRLIIGKRYNYSYMHSPPPPPPPPPCNSKSCMHGPGALPIFNFHGRMYIYCFVQMFPVKDRPPLVSHPLLKKLHPCLLKSVTHLRMW